jgi:hypothetical protein
VLYSNNTYICYIEDQLSCPTLAQNSGSATAQRAVEEESGGGGQRRSNLASLGTCRFTSVFRLKRAGLAPAGWEAEPFVDALWPAISRASWAAVSRGCWMAGKLTRWWQGRDAAEMQQHAGFGGEKDATLGGDLVSWAATFAWVLAGGEVHSAVAASRWAMGRKQCRTWSTRGVSGGNGWFSLKRGLSQISIKCRANRTSLGGSQTLNLAVWTIQILRI